MLLKKGHGGNHRAALHLAVRKKLGQWEIKKAKLPTSSTELLVMRRKLGQCGVRKPKLPTSSTEMFFLVVPLTQAPGSIFCTAPNPSTLPFFLFCSLLPPPPFLFLLIFDSNYFYCYFKS